jgi:hypothetical protein
VAVITFASGERGADDRTDRGNLIFHLDKLAAEPGQPRGQMLGDLRRGGDWVAGIKIEPGVKGCFHARFVALDKLDGFSHDALLLGFHFDGEIGASQLAEPAANAVLGPRDRHLVLFIQFEHLLGAELYADPAPLAPVAVDVVLFQLRFGHCSSPAACTDSIEFRSTIQLIWTRCLLDMIQVAGVTTLTSLSSMENIEF